MKRITRPLLLIKSFGCGIWSSEITLCPNIENLSNEEKQVIREQLQQWSQEYFHNAEVILSPSVTNLCFVLSDTGVLPTKFEKNQMSEELLNQLKEIASDNHQFENRVNVLIEKLNKL